jgi:N-acetylmuramate 1-kinase
MPYSLTLKEISSVISSTKFKVYPLKGDGSQKKFYRITCSTHSHNYIIMKIDDDPNRTNYNYWLSIQQSLKQAGIKCPDVIKKFQEKNTLVIEDCGDLLLNQTTNITSFLEKIANILITLQTIPPQNHPFAWNSRKFVENKFYSELVFFKTNHIDHNLLNKQKWWQPHTFTEEIRLLTKFTTQDCNVFTHRDFHSRNLILNNNELSMIDFQDARLGPASYDLVSFAFDPYTNLNLTQRLDFIENYLKTTNFPITTRQWKSMLLQRLLKAIGSFEFLSRERNRPYKKFIQKSLNLMIAADLFDKNWPYISTTLIEELHRYELSR